MVLGLGRPGLLPPRPLARKPSVLQLKHADSSQLAGAGTQGAVDVDTPALSEPPLAPAAAAAAVPQTQCLTHQQQVAGRHEQQQQQQQQEEVGACRGQAEQQPPSRQEQQQQQQEAEQLTHSHHSVAGKEAGTACTACHSEQARVQQRKRKQPEATTSQPSSRAASKQAVTAAAALEAGSRQRGKRGGKDGRRRGRGKAPAAVGAAVDAAAQCTDILGCTVEVPGSIFFVKTPKFFIGEVTRPDHRRKVPAVQMRFLDDESHYWFPVADVRMWIDAMVKRGSFHRFNPCAPGARGRSASAAPDQGTGEGEAAALVLHTKSASQSGRPSESDGRKASNVSHSKRRKPAAGASHGADSPGRFMEV